MKLYKALTIAGSDSSGGAGIQADLKTFSALGCYGMSAITAITCQNTLGVTAVQAIKPEIVTKQITAIFDDCGTDAIKTGMLFDENIIKQVYNCLKGKKNIVCDPVMISTSGSKLINDNAIEELKNSFFKISEVITPNLPEAETILQSKISSFDDFKKSAKKLADFGSKTVLLKGGHFEGENCTDVLFDTNLNKFYYFTQKRIQTKNTHGTGCTLSSAIAAFLAKGYKTVKAVELAIDYLHKAIVGAKDIEDFKGNGPVNHFYNFFEKN